MKRINWNHDKNRRLQEERGVSFEFIQTCIEHGQIHAIVKHPSRDNQRIFIILDGEDVLYIPFVETENEVLLKTIYKNSKARRRLKHEKR